MDQAEARKVAKEQGGIAILAKPKRSGGWLLGGWANKDSTWIVVTLDKSMVIAS